MGKSTGPQGAPAWHYAAGAFVIAAGYIAFMALLLTGLIGANQDLVRFRAPGETMITLPSAGEYTIFHEYRSLFGGERHEVAPELKGLRCTLEHTATGTVLEAKPVEAISTYSARGHKGLSVLRVTVSEPGAYRVVAQFADDAQPVETILSMAQWSRRRAPAVLARSWIVLAVSVIAGVAIIIRTARRRSAGEIRGLRVDQ